MKTFEQLRDGLATKATRSHHIEEVLSDRRATLTRTNAQIEHRGGDPMASESRLIESINADVAQLEEIRAAALAQEQQERDDYREKRELHERESEEARKPFAGILGEHREEAADSFADLLEGRSAALVLEQRAMSTGGVGVGAETVTSSMASTFYETLGTRSALYSAAGKLSTGLDISPIELPILASYGTGDQERGEGTAITADDEGLTSVTFNTYAYSGIQAVSNQLISSASVNVRSIVAKGLAQRLVDGYRLRLTTGTGTSQPQGITVGAGAGLTAASINAITADEIIELVHSVSPENRDTRRSAFVMADTTWQAVRKLKDSNGSYLVGDLVNGAALMLSGYKVIVDNSMPAATTGLVPIVFGAIEDAFIVRTTDVRIESSVDALWDKDQTSFRAVHYIDSKVIDASAIKKLTMA